jgi:hypothetical protein
MLVALLENWQFIYVLIKTNLGLYEKVSNRTQIDRDKEIYFWSNLVQNLREFSFTVKVKQADYW